MTLWDVILDLLVAGFAVYGMTDVACKVIDWMNDFFMRKMKTFDLLENQNDEDPFDGEK